MGKGQGASRCARFDLSALLLVPIFVPFNRPRKC